MIHEYRDKIAAARRKGKWSGGLPVLGYDVVHTKLVVNPAEADQVRELFRLYLEGRSLTAVVAAIDRRGWRTKEWTTHKGISRGGRPFDKTSLYHLLTNPVYVGKVRHDSSSEILPPGTTQCRCGCRFSFCPQVCRRAKKPILAFRSFQPAAASSNVAQAAFGILNANAKTPLRSETSDVQRKELGPAKVHSTPVLGASSTFQVPYGLSNGR
jgi:hypothetical protein